jgi:hypothetical protein
MRSHSSARWLRYCDGHEIAARISARLAQRSNCGVEFLFTPLQENHLADLFRLSASEAAARIREGKLTSEALVRSCLERIDSRESQVKAWVHLNDDFCPGFLPKNKPGKGIAPVGLLLRALEGVVGKHLERHFDLV